MQNDDTIVVSGSTEGAAEASPSTTDTQTAVVEPVVTAEPAATAPTDWRVKQREDASLNAHIQSEIARVRARDDRRALRTTAQTAVTTRNADAALEVSRQIAAEQDDEEVSDSAWRKSADQIQPLLNRMLRINASGQATDPFYVALHQATGKAEMDRRYDADPAAFYDWAEEQISEAKLEARLKKVVPALTKGIQSDAENAALRGAPSPLSGGTGGSSVITLDQYNADPAVRRKLQATPAGRAQIDAMMARASKD